MKYRFLIVVMLALLLVGCNQYRWRTHTFNPEAGAHEMTLGISEGDTLKTKFCGSLDQGDVTGTIFSEKGVVKTFVNQSSGCEEWDFPNVNESVNFTMKLDFSKDARGTVPFHYAVIPKN